MSLVGEIKRRQKTAEFGELPLRMASEAGEALAERAAVQASEDQLNGLPAAMIRPTVEARITNTVAGLVEKKQLHPRQAKAVIQQVMDRATPAIQQKEREAFRQESGQRVTSPATVGGVAAGIATGTAFPWLLTRGSYLWGKKPKEPMSLGDAFKFNFIPHQVLPWTVGIEALNHLVAPFSDPLRKRKERGYWKSVGESVAGSREHLADSGASARAHYGLLGMPIQVYHGIMNPLSSLAYLGQQVGGAFKKPDYAEWARQAVEKRQALQGSNEAE